MTDPFTSELRELIRKYYPDYTESEISITVPKGYYVYNTEAT